MKNTYNTYNDCNNNASETKQGEAIVPRELETMTGIEAETREALETANSILNFCLRTICFGNVEGEIEMQPECLMDLQRYNRELAQKVAGKAIKVREAITDES